MRPRRSPPRRPRQRLRSHRRPRAVPKGKARARKAAPLGSRTARREERRDEWCVPDDDEQSDKTEHSNPGDLPFKPREDKDDLKYEDDEATVIAPPDKKKGR